MTYCYVCLLPIDIRNDKCIICSKCHRLIHLKCWNRRCPCTFLVNF